MGPEQAAYIQSRDIVVRPLDSVEQMSIGVRLQQQVWRYREIDTVPDQIFIVAKETGGQVLAAFHDSEPVGFALAFVAMHHGKTYLHSHMVAVLPQYQDRGVGRSLKLAQREDAIARGFDLIEWTFDPIQLKNANFNISRLGAIVRRYLPNFYGRTSSPLHAGLPTDRLVAEWWLQSKHVQEVLQGKKRTAAEKAVRVSVPAAIREISNSDPEKAEHIQQRCREQFERHFAAGRAAVAFELEKDQGSYVLEPYED
jgi:predicted GNAT superfamily acetyltransferase